MPDPTDDAFTTFDALMGAVDPVVVVVTVAVDDQHDGCLVGFHSQCGIEPRRAAVWLSKPNRTTRLAQAPGCDLVAVHLLGADQHDLARRFGAETGDQVDKLADLSWTAGPGGVPLLEACPDRFVGRVISLTDVGADHLCVVLEPVEAQREAASRARGWLRLGDVGDLVAGHAPDEAGPEG
jgi:flavin reductase (DIM6/NTAB) family NADH-FMN oxidoreductase RutF